jgi:hypothetical protein
MIPLLSEQCEFFADPMRSRCIQLTTITVPFILRFIEEGISDQACDSFGFCERKVNARVPKLHPKSGSNIICHGLVDFMRENRDSGAIARYCESLPSQSAGLCHAIAHHSRSSILTSINEGLASNAICRNTLGFSSAQKKDPKRDRNCDFCRNLVQNIEKFVLDGKDINEMVTKLEKLCAQFPSASIVVDQVHQIIQWIEHGIEEKAICLNLGYCLNASTGYFGCISLHDIAPVYFCPK